VFALCPGLYLAQATRNCEIDGLIIAKLEMEEGHILAASPIAAI
jgi:hypothetical protein